MTEYERLKKIIENTTHQETYEYFNNEYEQYVEITFLKSDTDTLWWLQKGILHNCGGDCSIKELVSDCKDLKKIK